MPKRLPCPAVMFTHNVEAEIWRRHAETSAAHPEARCTARSTGGCCGSRDRRSRGSTASSPSRMPIATLRAPLSRRGAQPIHVVPTGVDTDVLRAGATDARVRQLAILIFTGSMDWLPNEDAMLFFCRDILPLIRAEEPDVTLSIVGRAPTPAVRRLADEQGVHVTGRVDDVRPFMREAAVYVVPLRIGGGTRLKIFEAMAMGKAVVSTTDRRRRAAGHGRRAPAPRRRTARIRAGRRRPAPRRRSAPCSGDRQRATLVVEHTTGRSVAADLEAALMQFARCAAVPAMARVPARRSQCSYLTTRCRCTHEGFGVRSRVCRLRFGGLVCRRTDMKSSAWTSTPTRSRRQRGPESDRRAGARRAAGRGRRGRPPAGDDRHRRRRCVDRGVAPLRRHAEPQERQPRPAVPGARRRRKSATRSRRRTPTTSWSSAAPCCRARRTSVVIPALERASGKKYGEGFGVSVNPEFLREGTALKDFRKPPLTLVGHNHAADASGTIALYQAIDAPLSARASASPR